jgi:hypothetical protein
MEVVEMKRITVFAAVAWLTASVLPVGWAGTNLNSSKSNIYRMVYAADLVTQAKADALLAELDKMGPADEAKIKQWLAANFRRFGIDAARVKHISVTAGRQISCAECVENCKGKCVKGPRGDCFCYEPITTPARMGRVSKASPAVILLLTDPADETAAFTKVTGPTPAKSNN